jgi:hypothetical protein
MCIQENRKSPRANSQWPISVRTAKGVWEAKLENLRPDGAYIYCYDTPDPQNFVVLTIDPPDREPLKIAGEVLWVDRFSSPGMEVRFKQMSEKDRQFLGAVVAKHYTAKTTRMVETD